MDCYLTIWCISWSRSLETKNPTQVEDGDYMLTTGDWEPKCWDSWNITSYLITNSSKEGPELIGILWPLPESHWGVWSFEHKLPIVFAWHPANEPLFCCKHLPLVWLSVPGPLLGYRVAPGNEELGVLSRIEFFRMRSSLNKIYLAWFNPYAAPHPDPPMPTKPLLPSHLLAFYSGQFLSQKGSPQAWIGPFSFKLSWLGLPHWGCPAERTCECFRKKHREERMIQRGCSQCEHLFPAWFQF